MASREEVDRLVIEHLPRMRRFALRLTRNQDDAEDLVQDGVVRILVGAHLWQTGTNFFSWVGTVLWNLHANHRLQAKRRLRREAASYFAPDGGKHHSVALPVETEGPQHMVVLVTEVAEAFEQLPSGWQELLLRVVRDGQPYEQIAEETGLPPGTVRSRLARGREQLRVMTASRRRITA